jgi:uncharacterized protein (TIGR00725 family)
MGNNLKNKPKVFVIGSEGDHASPKAKKIGRDVGKLLAQKGAVVLTGGTTGVMDAVAQGVDKANGIVIGITPGNDVKEGSKYNTLTLATGIGFARGQIMTNSADGGIIIEGGLGSKAEASFMYWQQKPTVAITASGGAAKELAGTVLDRRNLAPILHAETAEEAVDLVLREIRIRTKK